VVISLKNVYLHLKNILCTQYEEGDFEARELMRTVLGVSASEIWLGKEMELSDSQRERLEELTARRMRHEPLQYLLGEWDFYGRTFQVGEGVLIPRADTEPLAEACLSFLRDRKSPRVLDICTGSGCLAVTLAAERPDAEVWAIEKSPAAWEYFCRNNAAYGGRVHGILADALGEIPELLPDFDLILSNPPYLTGEEMRDLQPEVAREPAMALDGGEDGLYFYRELTARYRNRLKPEGMLAYEIGMGQQDAVSEILQKSDLNFICQTPDLHGIIRVVTAKNKFSPR
jgi:release factor glutamine methyltransferase